ncbi:MAG TPA: hypothetical protein VGF67_24105 [Ktedonobacteraceae bacterium]|jgi:hypothetical protein
MKGTLIIIWGLSALSILATVVILLVPLAIPSSDLANRAQVSAMVSSTSALILSIIAIISTARVSSSDYQAQQEVKATTARLLAIFRSIIVKGVVLSQKSGATTSPLNFEQEKAALNEFLSSTSAFAYWSWEGYKGQRVQGDEPWRVFFLKLIDILDTEDPQFRTMISRAFELEELLTKLTPRDMEKICHYVADLSQAIGDFETSAEADILINAAKKVYKPVDKKTILSMFHYLKETRAVNDPNIDLFLAVDAQSPEQVQVALDAGADMSVTQGQILAKYQSQLKDFTHADTAQVSKTPS